MGQPLQLVRLCVRWTGWVKWAQYYWSNRQGQDIFQLAYFSSHISARIFQLGVGQCGNSLNHRSNISHFPSRYSCYPKFWRSKYLPRAPPLEIDSFSVDRSTSCSGLRRQHFDTSLSIDLTRSDWKLQGQWCGFEYAIKEDNRAWHVHFSLMFQFILDCSSPFFLFHFVSFWSSSPIKWH